MIFIIAILPIISTGSLVFSGFVILIGIIFIQTQYSKKTNRIHRKLEKLSFSDIDQVDEGDYAKIKGIAQPIENILYSPIGNKKCVGYILTVQEKRRQGKNSYWRTLTKEIVLNKFVITQQHYKVMIDAQELENDKWIWLPSQKYQANTWFNVPETVQKRVSSLRRSKNRYVGDLKTVRYKEQLILENSELIIAGIGHWKKDGKQLDSYSDKSLCISGNSNHPLVIKNYKAE